MPGLSCADVFRSEERWSVKQRSERSGLASILLKRSEIGEASPRFHHPEMESFRWLTARQPCARNESEEIVGAGLTPFGMRRNNPRTNPPMLFVCPLRDFSAPTSRIASCASRARVSLKSNVHGPDGTAHVQEGTDAAACGSSIVHRYAFSDWRRELLPPLLESRGSGENMSHNLLEDATKKEGHGHDGVITRIHCACGMASADFKRYRDGGDLLKRCNVGWEISGSKNPKVVTKDHFVTAKLGIQISKTKTHSKTAADEWRRNDKEGGGESLRFKLETDQHSSSVEAPWKEDYGKEEEMPSSNLKRFPPPISILVKTSRPDLPSHMPRVFWKSMKRNGRFVLQERQSRPQEFFRAIRENGRLRLQLIRPDKNSGQLHAENSIVEKGEQTLQNFDKDCEREEEIFHIDTEVLEEKSLVNVHKSKSATLLSRSAGRGEVRKSCEYLESAACRKPSTHLNDPQATHSSLFFGSHDCSDREEDSRDAGMKASRDKSGEKSRRGPRPAQWNGSVGFDNALNLLAPTQSFLQFSFTRMRPVIG